MSSNSIGGVECTGCGKNKYRKKLPAPSVESTCPKCKKKGTYRMSRASCPKCPQCKCDPCKYDKFFKRTWAVLKFMGLLFLILFAVNVILGLFTKRQVIDLSDLESWTTNKLQELPKRLLKMQNRILRKINQPSAARYINLQNLRTETPMIAANTILPKPYNFFLKSYDMNYQVNDALNALMNNINPPMPMPMPSNVAPMPMPSARPMPSMPYAQPNLLTIKPPMPSAPPMPSMPSMPYAQRNLLNLSHLKK